MQQSNRRQWPRHEKLHLIQYTVSLQDGFKISSVVNFSRGGLCLIHREPMRNGAWLMVRLDQSLAGIARDVPARVRWCVPSRIGGYAIGLEYESNLSWTGYE